ncbi:MAG: group I truncated hemoglobin [Acidimicrobiales bacterium]
MSIYDAIGGDNIVAEAVEAFYAKLSSDPIIGGFFDGSDVDRLETHQRMFLTAALGGPDAYEGRDMRAAHAHLEISDTDFDVFLKSLAETLAEAGVDADRIAEVLDALASLRIEIVSAAQDGPDEWGSQDPTGGGD